MKKYLFICLFLSGCSSAAYSPNFSEYDCDQLKTEMEYTRNIIDSNMKANASSNILSMVLAGYAISQGGMATISQKKDPAVDKYEALRIESVKKKCKI